MVPSEFAAIQYLATESQFQPNFPMIQSINTIPSFNFQNNSFPNYQLSPPLLHDQFTPQSTSLSNYSTSDEAEEQQLSAIDERRQRRMISNRESARRSRMRKQMHLDELRSQVSRLRTENHSLMDRLNQVCECHDKVVQENARLKEETSDLRQMLSDLQIPVSHPAVTRDLEELTCNTAHLRAEYSIQSLATMAANLLH
ncbi:basic leucine zipper 43-like [Diospyros lotus]|uniref:basic leucine zipper 43-like n=1 Tax=Diospyros lotus TaxID=55363 RepID=UPI00224CCA6E|nr:basic leucine zipper 43-like [Diospyros lotus]